MKVLLTGAGGQLGQALISSAPKELQLVVTSRQQLDLADPEACRGAVEQHQPDWVLIELGANDGLRGWSPDLIRKNLTQLINLSQQSGAKVALMQIEIPPNYGKRYTKAFSNIYPELSKEMKIPLIPFFMEKVVLTPGWLMADGLHPKEVAQPYIADFVANKMTLLLENSDKK